MLSELNYEGTVRYIPCLNCGSGNPAGAAICARCGKPLQAAAAPPVSRPNVPPSPQLECPGCHQTFPAGSRFCGFCGTPLAPPLQQTLPQQPSPRPVAPPIPPKVAPQVSAPGVSRLSPTEVGSEWAPFQPSPALPAAPAPSSPVARPQPPAISPPLARPGSTPDAPSAPLRAPAPSRPVPPTPPPLTARADFPEPAGAPEGTLVFGGLRAPTIQAQIKERAQDGSWGNPLQIVGGVSIGRANCEINFPADPRLSDRHALLSTREGKLFLADLGSQSGTFIRQRKDSELLPGDVFLLGHDLFRLTTQSLDQADNPGPAQGTVVWAGPAKLQRGPVTAKLEHLQLTGEVIEEFRLEKPETTLGRTTANLVFKDDPYMSSTHARIVAQPGRFILQDLRSRNGVFRRIGNEIELEDGDEFFLGEHFFQVEIKRVSG